MDIAINVENLYKLYKVGFLGKKVKVLDNVNFSVRKGETFGLLGPNGAGKTSTLKILVGISKQTKGNAYVLGKTPFDINSHRKIGYLPETPYIYSYLTGKEFLYFCGKLFGITGKSLNNKINELLDLVGLDKISGNKQLKSYSKGMLQRIGIAQALINNPEIVFLDEPMSGLDPIGRHDIKDIMKTLKKQGRTIFFNTHILSDVEELCDSIAIMVKGKIVTYGNIQDILKPVDNIFNVYIKDLNSMGKTNVKRACLKLIENNNNIVIAVFNDIDTAIKGMAIAKQSGGTILEMKPYKPSLEEVFVNIVKENADKKELLG